MLTLYNKGFTTKYGTINTTIEAFVEEERNGLFELSFIMLNTDSLFNYVKEDNIVVANANNTLLNQKFRIYMTRKLMNNRVEVFARHISFDLMYDYIDSVKFENQSCEYALNMLFRNSNFSKHYKGYSDIINAQDYNMSMANILEAIGGKEGSLLDTFGTGAELLRDNENIHVLNKRGHDNSVAIEYKKNLTGFELEEDTTELITRILPYAKYTPKDSEGNSLDEVIVKASFVDSSLISNYSHPFIKAIDYSDKFEDENIPTVDKLKALAELEYKNNKVDKPKQNFKIEFIPLSKCVGYEGLSDNISLCDTVTIKDTRYNINTQAKVIKVTYNVLKNRYESMELGEPKTSLADIVGGNSGEASKGEQGPPGPQGPPGADGDIGDFPNSLPSTPVVTTKVYGFANIEISWTFENKVYYQYEVYASKQSNFTPNSFNLIHSGQTSTYMYQAKPNETWYFKVCCVNTHGERTAFGSAYATTTKIDDLSNYVEKMAISDALIGTMSLDRGWVGTLRGNYIDAKQLSVTDGNGERTFDIDSFGNVHIKASTFSLAGKNIATEEELNKTVKKVDVMYYLSTSSTALSGGSWSITAPTWTNGKYMWSKTVTTYMNGTKSETSPICIAGAKGDTGKGIKNITNYYLSSANSSSVTTATAGWTTYIQNPTSTRKYLWNYERITYTDDTYLDTLPCVIGNYSQDGVNGKGISSILEYYLTSASSTGVTTSTSGWSTSIKTMTPTNKYLWNYEKITYTDGSTTTGTPKIIGAYGNSGADGVGIKEIIEQYYLSTSKTSQIGGSWVLTPPSWSKGKYLWIRSKITYTDNSIVYTTAICDTAWEAIEQQTSLDIFNKLTDNGKKQGLYMENDQLYLNGQYINAKNLSVTNNQGKKTLNIDSSGNVSLNVANMKINNGTTNESWEFKEDRLVNKQEGTTVMSLMDGRLNMYSYSNNKFTGYIGSYLEKDLTDGMIISNNGNSKFITLGRRASTYVDNNIERGEYSALMTLVTSDFDNLTKGIYCLGDFKVNAGYHARFDEYIIVPRIKCSTDSLLIYTQNSGAYGGGVELYSTTSSSYFRPQWTNKCDLGSSSNRWKNTYLVSSPSVSSDATLKENIEYIKGTTNARDISDNITTSDMYEFIRDDLKLATYNYIDSEDKKYGFIAQDIENTKVGKEILNKNNEDSILSYDMGNRIAILEGALQKAIEEIENLKKKINN